MASGSGGGGSAAQPLQLAAAWVLMASGGRGIAARPTQFMGVAPFENGQYARLLDRGRGGYRFADESEERVRTDHHHGLILEGDSPHILLRGAYGRYVAGMPMGAGEGPRGGGVLETMDTDVMWRTVPGPRGGGVVLINASSYNGVLRALRANGKYQRWNTGVSLQYIDRFNARFSSMMEWEVQVIPTRVQRPPFQVGGEAWLCGLQRRGSGEIQVGVRVADDDGNFNIPGGEILLISGGSLIELGSALEERFNMRFGSMMEWEIQVIPTRFQVGQARRLCGLRRRGSGEIQVGVSVADHDGNFNILGGEILLISVRSLIELGSALEDRLSSSFRFWNMSIFIRAGSLGQPFPLLTDLPSELDYFEVVVFMVGTPGEKLLTDELTHSVFCTLLFFCQK
uniref:DUF569 domain-containing protein n=1 Tax=Oryza glumipatula TaxID=40148 RepID=A0A0D9ZCG2_9ORYZ